MNKVWLDVTTVLRWQRSAVGVVRVEAECAAYILRSGKESVHFCRFEDGQYLEVGVGEISAALNRIYGIGTSGGEPKVTTRKIGKDERLKIGVRRLINLLPGKLKEFVLGFLTPRREAFYAALRGLREARYALKAFVRPLHVKQLSPVPIKKNGASKVPFEKGDIYVSLGLDWDQKDLEYLYKLKGQIELKILLFCYDIIPVKFPHLCVGNVAATFAHYFSNVAWCADKVLCISECSKRDLENLLTMLGAPIPKMSVVKLGCQLPEVSQGHTSDIADLLEQRYILFVSTIERRKNHEVLYRAYTRLIDQGLDIPLMVFVGMPGWGTNELMLDLELDVRVKNRIKILNQVGDADLMRLYQNAYFTVYPSLYEGWGLPVAESLAAGKFCLASNAASIPEVGGDLIEYLDPWDAPKWTERLKWYFEHPEIVEELSTKIRKEYNSQSWEKTAMFIIEQANNLRSESASVQTAFSQSLQVS